MVNLPGNFIVLFALFLQMGRLLCMDYFVQGYFVCRASFEWNNLAWDSKICYKLS